MFERASNLSNALRDAIGDDGCLRFGTRKHRQAEYTPLIFKLK